MVKHGFTLIELLIVLGILALLVALLFPVFLRAKERAQQTACASNLHQIGLAMTMYANDHDRLLPPFALNDDNIQVGGSIVHIPSQNKELIASVRPYSRSEAIWYCPSDSPADGKWHGMAYHSDSSYRYEGLFFSHQLGMLSVDFSRDTPIYGVDPLLMGEVCSPNLNSPSGNYSHSGRSNELFRDGHVKAAPIHSSTYDYPDAW